MLFSADTPPTSALTSPHPVSDDDHRKKTRVRSVHRVQLDSDAPVEHPTTSSPQRNAYTRHRRPAKSTSRRRRAHKLASSGARAMTVREKRPQSWRHAEHAPIDQRRLGVHTH
jgi:hypothetical protein